MNILHGLRETDKVLIIEDQNEDLSNDQQYQHLGKLGLNDNKINQLNKKIIRAKDYPTYVQTQVEKENEILKNSQTALLNNYQTMQEQMLKQQEQIQQLMAMMAKQGINTEANAVSSDEQSNNANTSALPDLQGESSKSEGFKPLLARKKV